MENQQLLIAAVVLLAVIVLFVVFSAAPAKPPVQIIDAQSLLINSTSFGEGIRNYTYSFNVNTENYSTNYTLVSNGMDKLAIIDDQLSVKQLYLLSNDTIFCISYPKSNTTCESIYQNASYVSSIEMKFFNDSILAESANIDLYLLQKGYLKLDPQIVNTTIGGSSCSQIIYTIDFSSVSSADAANMGLTANTPKVLHFTDCVDPQTGLSYQSTMSYSDLNGTNHTSTTTLISFANTSSSIESPAGNYGDAVGISMAEESDKSIIGNCFSSYITGGPDWERCIADQAINYHREYYCDMLSARKDRCLVSLVPLTKDTSICDRVIDPSYKDDCYIELAGAFKNSTYCSDVQNSSKMPLCQSVATVANTTVISNATTSQNVTVNMTQLTPYAVLVTTMGNITIAFNQTNAPLTVQNFEDYVYSGFYNGTIFHRVIPGFMIQGGGYTSDGTQKPTNPPITLEASNGLSNVRGAIAMARTSDPNSATSQFFINTVDNSQTLDHSASNDGYAVFGQVISGMDVVDSISSVPTTTNGQFQNWPDNPVIITGAFLESTLPGNQSG